MLVVFLLWINGYFNKSEKDFVLRECYKNVSELVVFFIFTIPQLNIKHFNMNKMNCTRKRTKGGAVKFLSIAILLLMSIGNAFGQVSLYAFAQSSGSYTAISGGTNIASTHAAMLDDNTGSALPIGFTFNYNGTSYTTFGYNANGWINLGSTAPTSSTTAISTGSTNNVISALNANLIGRGTLTINRTSGSPTVTVTAGDINLISVGDAVEGTGLVTGATVVSKTATTVTLSSNASSNGTGSQLRFLNSSTGVRYETIGTSPNRTLVVQWTGFTRYNTTTAFGELYNFQIRLSEGTNAISTVYNILGPNSTTTNTYQIGLRGASSSDYNNRTTTTNWASTTAGGSNSAS